MKKTIIRNWAVPWITGLFVLVETTVGISIGCSSEPACEDAPLELAWVLNGASPLDDSIASIGQTDSGGIIVAGVFGETNQPESTAGVFLGLDGSEWHGTSAKRGSFYIAYFFEDGYLYSVETGGGDGQVFLTGLQLLPDGTVIISGAFTSTLILGLSSDSETAIQSAGGWDGFIAKYAATGEFVWVRSFGGTDDDSARAVGCYSDGSCVVTGHFRGDLLIPTGSAVEVELSAAGEQDVLILLWDAEGDLLWARSAGGARTDSGTCTSLTPDGALLIAGVVCADGSGDAVFGLGEAEETTLTVGDGPDAFIAKYDQSGSLGWVRQISGKSGEMINDIESLDDGSFVIAGGFWDSAVFSAGGEEEILVETDGRYNEDAFLASFTSSGSPEWVTSPSGGGYDSANDIQILDDGSILVVGEFGKPSTGLQPPNTITFELLDSSRQVLQTAGDSDAFVAGFNSGGVPIWARSEGGQGPDGAKACLAMKDGSFVIAGTISGTVSFGLCEANQTDIEVYGERDYFIAKLIP